MLYMKGCKFTSACSYKDPESFKRDGGTGASKDIILGPCPGITYW